MIEKQNNLLTLTYHKNIKMSHVFIILHIFVNERSYD